MIEADEKQIEGLELIGRGASGNVYKYGEDRVLKLFHDKWKKEKVEKAYNISKAVSDSDVPAAKMYDLVKFNRQYGYIAQLLPGTTLPVYIGADVQKRYDAAVNMGKILRKVHLLKPDETIFPPVSEMFGGLMEICADYLTEDQIRRFIDFVDRLPGGKCVLHGDFHENNIMMSDGRYYLIDLDGMCIGSPFFDFMQTYCVYRTKVPEEYVKKANLSEEVIQEFLYLFLENYYEITDRKILKKYDALYTKASAFMRFFAPIFIRNDTEEKIRKHVDDNIDGIMQLIDELETEIPMFEQDIKQVGGE